jgi:hypothetical protein
VTAWRWAGGGLLAWGATRRGAAGGEGPVPSAAAAPHVGWAPPHRARRRWGSGALLLAALAALAPPAVAQSAAHRSGPAGAAPASAAPRAVTDTGGGPETFVLLTGLVGGVGGFGRL